jgi:hypothetical protein
MSLPELREEYASLGIGPKIYHELMEVARNVTRSYNPTTYGGAANWTDALDDLIQEFVLRMLIGEGQLDYIMNNAGDISHLRRLLKRLVRRFLARARQRTIVDNLIDRCKTRSATTPFKQLSAGPRWSFTLDGPTTPGKPADAEIYAAAVKVSTIPVIAPSAGQRAPIIYGEESLAVLMRVIAENLRCPITAAILDRVFNLILTPWIPRFLDEDEGSITERPSTDLGPEEQVIVEEIAKLILAGCSSEQKEVLRLKLTGTSDADVGAALGISRPTVAKRKSEALSIVETHLSDRPEAVQSAVIDLLGINLLQ